MQAGLRAGGVRVTRRSVNQKVTDFSALVATIGDEVDVVYLPWQIAANGQIFGQQLKAQGKRAVVFGGDGLDSGDFKVPGSYVAAFAPDVRGVKGNAGVRQGVRRQVRLQLRPAGVRGDAGCDRGDPEGVRGRRGDARGGAERR